MPDSTVPDSTVPDSTVPRSTVPGSTPTTSPTTGSPGPKPILAAAHHAVPAPDPTSSAAAAGFHDTITRIDGARARRMRASWHAGCPVPLDQLSYLTLSYRGFDRADHTGELVVASVAATQVVAAFRGLYRAGFPIRSMRLVDDFGGNDDASMAADNTSGFNCRLSTSGPGWSQHSYGQAVDVDPLENPYVSGDQLLPPGGARFADRPDSPGVIHDGDACVRAFAAVGWSWGGDWSDPTDYQHFSATGR